MSKKREFKKGQSQSSDKKKNLEPFKKFMKKKATAAPKGQASSKEGPKKRTEPEKYKGKIKSYGSKEKAEAPAYDMKSLKEAVSNINKNKPATEKGEQIEEKKVSNEPIRLNRFIANAGVCSRREADTLIEQGLIKVNGKTVREMGHKVSPSDKVSYKDKPLSKEKLIYVLLNKPKGFITTTKDPKERRTVMSLVENACDERIYPVGRLDRNTTGLLLFTNDGDLTKTIAHPTNETQKIYYVLLDREFSEADENKLRDRNFALEDGPVNIDGLSINIDRREIGIELHSGKNRIVRRIFEHFGYTVEKLDRTVLAGLTKKDLPRGKWRYLNSQEVINLKHLNSKKKKKK